jgi:alkylated DNA repair dioxygenase AlkB
MNQTDIEMETTIDKIIKFLNDERYGVRTGSEHNSYIEIICDFSDDNKIIKTWEFLKFIDGLNLKMDYIYGWKIGLWKDPAKYIKYYGKYSAFDIPTLSNDGFETLWDLRPTTPNMMNMFGKSIEAPRRYKVYGKPYKFTGMKDNNVNEIPPIVIPYLYFINSLDRFMYNSVLINWYENEDYIGYHSDNENNLQVGSHIYGISFGEDRIMRFKNIETKEILNYNLTNNSLIVMRNGCQKKYQHSILKNKNLTGKRINITFRCVV